MTLDGSTTLEIDLGYTLVAPNAGALREGNSFTLTSNRGVSHTFEFDSDGFFGRNIRAVDGRLLQDGQSFQVRANGQTKTFEFDSGVSLRVPAAGGNPGGLRDGDTFQIDGVVFEFDTDGNFTAGREIINLIVDSGLQVPAAGSGTGGLQEGDQVIINDGAGGADVVFEFDRDRPASVSAGARAVDITNLELRVPVAGGGFGGINDGDRFIINDGLGGPDVVFEFDKNNTFTSGNRVISITDQSTQDEVANAMVIALQLANIGLNPVNQGGGVIRLGVFRHSVDTTNTPRLSSRVTDATQDEIADRLADAILNSGLGLTPINSGQGLVRLGSTTHQVDAADAPSLQFRRLAGSQNEVAARIVTAIDNSSLNVQPLDLGNGQVYLGRQVTNVDVAGAPSLLKIGEVGLRDSAANPVVFSPLDTAAQVADSISDAINDDDDLNITTSVNGGVVELPSNATFAPNNTALSPDGIRPITFSAQDTPAGIAANIESAIETAFAAPSLTADLTQESNDTLTTAIDAGFPGGPANFQASGFIGDNPALNFRRGSDVDFVKVVLDAGDNVQIQANSPPTSNLSPAVRIFNAKGEEVTRAFGSLNFNAVTAGIYYVAVSSAANFGYNPNFEGSADLTLQVPSQGGAIGGITDGESFSITNGPGGNTVVFEFDSNGRVSNNSIPIRLTDVLLQVPSAAAGQNGIQDGDTFVIDDHQGNQVEFEFDSDGVTAANTKPIFLFPQSDTPNSIANRIVSALINADIGLSPVALGNGSIQLGTTTHTADISGTPTMTSSAIPRSQQDLAVLIRDAIRNARIGLVATLRGQGNLDLDVRNHLVDTTLAPNLRLISPSNTGAYNLSINIIEPFDVLRDGNRVNLLDVSNLTTLGLPATFVEGRPGVSQSNRIPVPINIGMSRAEVAQEVSDAIGRSTAGFVQQIIAASGADIRDGEIFSIGDGTTTVNFEFDSGYSLQIPDPSQDPNAFLDQESFSITRSGATVRFEFDDNGAVTAGSVGVRFNDIILDVPFLGVGFGGIADGDTIVIDPAGNAPPVTFEYDTDGAVTAGNRTIAITPTSSQNDIANAMVLAFRQANIGLSPVNLGQGQVQLGVTTQAVDISNTPALNQRIVLLSQDELADKIVRVIRDANLGLTPQNLGGGVIHVGGDSSHLIDVSNALRVRLIGSPGPNDPDAIVIPIFPSASTSPAEVAQLIVSAIETAVATRGLQVTATLDGSRRINLQANLLETEFSNAPSLSVNVAGNTVKLYDNIVKVIGHTVTNPGPFGLETNLAGDSFGAFNTSGPPNATNYPGALRGMNNAREGAYIDDIIIGFAERGEMVTGAPANSNFITNNELINPDTGGFHNEIHVGPYQLEVRRAEAFGRTVSDAIPQIFLQQAFDTNDRLSSQVSLTASPGHGILDGQTLVVSDGGRTITYEFEDLDLNNGVTQGRVSIGYRVSDTDAAIARRIRDAINSPATQAVLQVSASISDGTATGQTSTGNQVNLFGNATISFQASSTTRTGVATEPSDTLIRAIDTGIGSASVATFTGTGTIGDNSALTNLSADTDLFVVQLDSDESLLINVNANRQQLSLDAILRVFDANGVQLAVNDDTNGLDPQIEFTAPTRGTYYIGVSGFSNFFYNPAIAGSGGAFGGQFSTGPYEIVMEKLAGGFRLEENDEFADSNVVRDQGQIIIESNRITHSSQFGIVADAGRRDGLGNTPHQGPARVTRELNVANLVPGVTIANNVIARNSSGGIHFSGDAGTTPQGPIPFGRIFNNTIVGQGGSSVGIRVDNNASPTLLNNLLSNLGTGISVDATSSSTVVGGTVYHELGTKTVGTGEGSFPIEIPDGSPMFVDETGENYYLAAGSRAIDSSINSVQDRPELLAIKQPLGMEASPILAPDLDALGQIRVDDPTVNTPPGQGGNVFKDRGAVDRADFSGPSAVLLIPSDNDQQGIDTDRRSTIIELTNQVLTNFSIQLLDGVAPTDAREGTGADDKTVRSDRVSIFRDGEKLVEGLDYTFHYDATNNIIRLTPLAGIWEPDRQYEITLSNSQGTGIAAPNGAEVNDGETFSITDNAGNQVTFEFDSGYVLTVPQTLALQIPVGGGAAIADGETFTITDGTITEIFEFDSDGATANDTDPPPDDLNIVISFTRTDTANDIANKIVAAIQSSDLDLSPFNTVNAGGRAVHLGSQSIHTLDTSNTTLQQTGQAGGIEDGQTFTIDDGTKVTTFEFVEGNPPAGNTTNRLIPFRLNQTNDEIADAIVNAIRAANVSLNPTHHVNSDGLIHVGGTTRHIINVDDSTLVLSGLPGVRPAWGIKIPTVAGKPDFSLIEDGQTFSLTNGTRTVTFELDSDGNTTAGNRAITFNSRTTTDQLANAIAIAIRNADLGLSPTNSGGGVVTLVGTPSYSIDLTDAELIELGAPGVPAAEAVEFVPGDFYTPGVPTRTPIFSEQQMAQAIADAIDSAKEKNLLDPSVEATVRNDEVLVDGVASIEDITSITRSNIRDIAGNSLKPNRADGTTSFTVSVGSGVDYGDAPNPYPTNETQNGARHQIVGDFYLGSGVDIDFDGHPDPDGLGDDSSTTDDEDGVVVTQVFTGGYGGALTVTASAAGFLDAWVDWNLDGDWNDTNEQIFTSRALVAGANDLTVNVPGNALPGETFGRFRFSSKGGLQATGFADDGEVEDHQIELRANPWRNSDNGADVDRSGFVVPLDALIIINDLNRNGPRPLPNPPVPPNVPPPFLDVNGDGFVTALDVLGVINVLNAANRAGGEGEGERGNLVSSESGEGNTASTAQSSDSSFFVALDDNAPLYFGADQVEFVDHRLASTDESDEEEELFAVQDYGRDDDSVLDALAASSSSKRTSSDSLADIFATDLDELFDGIVDSLKS